MLVLTRRIGETVHIGDDVKVTLLAIRGRQARIGIDAPATVTILRSEVCPRGGRPFNNLSVKNSGNR
jgi:carbon storage regulator